MKNTSSKILVISLIASLFVACGTNNDNLEILNSTNFPEITTFTSTGAYNSGAPFTVNTPYWTFNTSAYGNYIAPARGVISEVGTSNIIANSSYVTIIHSGRIATRVHGLSSLSVRAGDTIAATGLVGIFVNSTSIAFQVLLDGASVCPLSFVSATLRAGLFNNPCQ